MLVDAVPVVLREEVRVALGRRIGGVDLVGVKEEEEALVVVVLEPALRLAEGYIHLALGDHDLGALVLGEAVEAASEALVDAHPAVLGKGCRIDPLRPDLHIGERTLRSDGMHLWPGELAYFVRSHAVRVPDDVVAAMRAANWRMPLLGDDEIVRLINEAMAGGGFLPQVFTDDLFTDIEAELAAEHVIEDRSGSDGGAT